MSAPAVVILVNLDGRVVERLPLAHGQQVEAALAEAGYVGIELTSIGGRGEPHEIELEYRVLPLPPGERAEVPSPRRVEPGLTEHEIDRAQVRQRVAAYAVVVSERGLLLTELSDRTGSPGLWTLPGGGIDPGESALEAVRREVWEESGQRIVEPTPLRVESDHWIGRAPSGHVEDFNAVRIVYRAQCPEPTDPVVHDVGGTTWRAAWFAPDLARGLRLSRTASRAVADLD